MATQSPADLHSAITAFSKLDDVLPDDDELRLALDAFYGFALAGRSSVTGSAADRDDAIYRLRRVTAGPGLTSDFDGSLLVLGQLLASRLLSSDQDQASLPSDGEVLRDLDTAIDALAVAAESATLQQAQRAEARALHAHLIPLRALGRSWAARKAGELPDLNELDAVLRDLPADHPSQDQLTLEAGLVHGSLAMRESSPVQAAQMRRYLTGVVERISPNDFQRVLALMLILFDLLSQPQTGPDAIPPDRIFRLAEESATAPDLDREVAALLHLLIGMAHSALTQSGRSAPAGAHRDAMAHFNQAKDLAPDIAYVRAVILSAISGSLSLRATGTQALDDSDAATVYGRQLTELADAHGIFAAEEARGGDPHEMTQAVHPAIRRSALASDQLSSAFLAADLAGVDAALEQLAQLLAEVPPDNQYRCLLLIGLGGGWRMRGALSGDRDDTISGLRMLVSGCEQAERNPLIAHLSRGWGVGHRAVYPAAELAWLTGDTQAISAAIRRMSMIGDEPGLTRTDRVAWSWQYGMTLIRRYDLTGDRRDLDDGIARLEGASHADDPAEAAPDSGLLQNLATAYWSRGDRRRGDLQRAIDTGLLALRQRTAEVLLQTGAERALRLARWQEQPQVAQLVGWCLTEERLDQAVTALEQGRALVLHTATVAMDVADLLRAAGMGELAAAWQEAASAADPVPWDNPLTAPGIKALLPSGPGEPIPVPAGVRHQALEALHHTSAGAELLAPPDLGELAAALRRARADAFVYLLPPFGENGGSALVLHAGGKLEQIPLPGLADGPLDSYVRTYHKADEGEWYGPARLEWQQALEELCGWAWDAAIGPVLDRVTGWPGRTSRLVLIPIGLLSVVPWHAARITASDGRAHYAVEDAVFSYAASARQVARASRRPRRPWSESPVLVSNPTDDLPMAQLEVRELLRRCYQGAVYLGRPQEVAAGPGTAAEVLSRLPGGGAAQASLLHCGCHANVAASMAASHLVLANGERLPIAKILAQAQQREHGGATAPGFLAVLSACMSDLARSDHDEALTLASALLAAGASGVVGARWPVEDRVAAPLMVMFHHFLNHHHSEPAAALRAAQLWMLDPSRSVLGNLPDALASASRRSRLAATHAWAAFTYQGV